jgi:hypothetical protein
LPGDCYQGGTHKMMRKGKVAYASLRRLCYPTGIVRDETLAWPARLGKERTGDLCQLEPYRCVLWHLRAYWEGEHP